MFQSNVSAANDTKYDSIPPIDSSFQIRVGFSSLFTVKQADIKKGPLEYTLNDKAISFIQTYMDKQGAELKQMKTWAKPYFNLYDGILENKGLPTQLKYLSVIESHLSSSLTSWAGAVGPWQIMPEEATRLGLKLTPNDERMDYEKSTQAAATLLKELYTEFGDWLLVVAAYNGGAGRIRQAIKKMKTNDFWALQYELPLETRNHVKKFIATNYVFESDQMVPFTSIHTIAPVKKLENPTIALAKLMIKGRFSTDQIAQFILFPKEKIDSLNPQMEKILATGKSFEITLPKDKLALFEASKNEILQASIQSLYKIKGN